ncbi:MAG: guanylate kinase [Clostridia bacterium]|nr:guanylate kinase [Clostridia bacterium]
MKNRLFVISGPAGVGKGTLVKLLLQEDPALALSVSCTTRAPRKGEVQGREYFFLTKEGFQDRIDSGDFLEWDEHFGNFYGTPKSFVLEQLEEKSIILEIDVAGARQVKQHEADFGRIVLIMIVPPDMETLKSRLVGRGSETEETLKNRLARVEYEYAQKDKYDYVVVNDNLEEAKRTLQNIILQETNRGDKHD